MRYIANPVSVTALRILAILPFDAAAHGTPLKLEDGTEFLATPEMTARYIPVVEDYVVRQSDGYVYLNPKDVFERKYRPDTPGSNLASVLQDVKNAVDSVSDKMRESLSYHRPNDEQVRRIEVLRAAQVLYAAALEQFCPPSRARSIAETEFETSCVWAVKSIVLEK